MNESGTLIVGFNPRFKIIRMPLVRKMCSFFKFIKDVYSDCKKLDWPVPIHSNERMPRLSPLAVPVARGVIIPEEPKQPHSSPQELQHHCQNMAATARIFWVTE